MSFFGLFKKVEIPSSPVVFRLREMVQEDLAYTQDAPFLERRYDQFVFVPNEMMSNHKEHDKLGESKFKISFGFTDHKYTFWQQNAGEHTTTIPLEEGFKDTSKARIKGELYLLNSSHMFELDKYHKNGVEFTRKLVKILIPYRRAKNFRPNDRAAYEWMVSRVQFMGEVTAWMYTGVSDYWTPLLEKGTKLSHLNKSGIKSLTRINSHGTFSTVSCFQPNNPDLDIYYYFVNAKTGSNHN